MRETVSGEDVFLDETDVRLGRRVSGIVLATGRLVAIMLGLVFLIVGVVLTVTVVGAIVGIPFIIFGLFLMIRGLF